MKVFQLWTFLLTLGLIQYSCTAHYQVSAEETDKTTKNKRSILDVSPYLSHYFFPRPSNQNQNAKQSIHAVVGFKYSPGNEPTQIENNDEQAHIEILSKYPKEERKHDQSYGDQSPVFNNNGIDSRLEFAHSAQNVSGSVWNSGQLKMPAAHDGLSNHRHRNGHRRKTGHIDAEFESVAVGSVEDLPNDDSNLLLHPASGTNEIVLSNCSNYRHTNIKIYNLRIVINIIHEIECLKCPGNKIIVAKQGKACAPLLLPVVKSCSASPTRTRPQRLFLMGNKNAVGRNLPEGSHIIHLRFRSKSGVTKRCAFRYHVRVNRCPIPKCIANGSFRCTDGREWGSRCDFTCDHGYNIEGNSTSDCKGDSTGVLWTEFPVCKGPPGCDRPPEIENAEDDLPKNTNKFPLDTWCSYRCKSGYKMAIRVDTWVQCVRGSWTEMKKPLICIPVPPPPTTPPPPPGTCDRPTEIENAEDDCVGLPKDTNKFPLGTWCSYRCKSGYEMATTVDTWINCVNGRWTPLKEPINCTRNGCKTPADPENGFLHPCANNVGSVCRYGCHPRYYIPVDQLWREYIECISDVFGRKVWNSTVPPDCHETCATPPKIQNADHNCGSHYEFRSGTTCSYTCNDGYDMATPINTTIQCNRGSWTDINLICQRRCTPTEIENVDHNCGLHNEFRSGTTCSYRCHDECKTEPTIDTWIQCYDGRWQPPIICPHTAKGCRTPAIPKNGFLDRCAKDVGSVCRYGCHPGYDIPVDQLEREYIECICKFDEKVWNSTVPPDCHGTCGSPEKIENAHHLCGSHNEFRSGTICSYRCNDGYKTITKVDTRIMCYDGSWSVLEPPLNCTRTCDRPPEIENAHHDCVLHNEFPTGTICYYRCNDECKMETTRAQCYDGRWEMEQPIICPQNGCGMLANPKNGVLERSVCDTCANVVGTTGRYRCHAGYAIPVDQLGREYIECICNVFDEKVWNSTEPPDCDKETCGRPPEIKNAEDDCVGFPKDTNKFPLETWCSYRCKSGYVMATQIDTWIQCYRGSWTPLKETLICTTLPAPTTPPPPPGTCRRPPEIENADYDCDFPKDSDEFPPGTNCSYCCKVGYKMETVVDTRIRCENGRWTDMEKPLICLPKGTAKGCGTPAIPKNGYLECSVCDTCAKDVGSVCRYRCHSGFAIPVDQLWREYIECIHDVSGKKVWNSTVPPDCLGEGTPPPCDITVILKKPFKYRVKEPIIYTSTGKRATDVWCSLTNTILSDFGEFTDDCIAVNPDDNKRFSSRCRITIIESDCRTLKTPANADMSCGMVEGKNIFRCDFKCHPEHFFETAFEALEKKGYVDCDVNTAQWDFTRQYGIKFLPDCVREDDTDLTTGIIFKVTVEDCRNENNIVKVKENIRKALLNRNNIECSQVDCTGFTYMCNLDQHGVSILEISWNITARYTPVAESNEDYDYGIEAEVLLTEIQQNTYSIITNDTHFLLLLKQDGAVIKEESYKQGLMDLICSKKAHVFEEGTNRCFQCPTGSYYSNNACLLCPYDSYQDETGQAYCKKCSDGSITWVQGAKNETECIDQDQLRQLHENDNRFNNPKCYQNFCRNGGTCYVVGREDICHCPDGFIGNYCETETCKSDTCSNGGKCRYEEGHYTCSCPVGTAGSKCETSHDQEIMTVQRANVDYCSSAPCMKGGICVQPKMNDFYYCECPKDRAGDHCEHAVCPEPYDQLFCLNGGRCVILDDTHAMVCLCKPGFIGSRCEFTKG